MGTKPVRNFSRKMAVIYQIEGILLSINTIVTIRVFRFLFRKEHKTNNWDNVNYTGIKSKIYRLSERTTRRFTYPTRKYLAKHRKRIYAKQSNWAESQ